MTYFLGHYLIDGNPVRIAVAPLAEADARQKGGVGAGMVAAVRPGFGWLLIDSSQDLELRCFFLASGSSVRLPAKSLPSPVGHQALGIAPLGK